MTDWQSDKKLVEVWRKINDSYKFAKYALRKKRVEEMMSNCISIQVN